MSLTAVYVREMSLTSLLTKHHQLAQEVILENICVCHLRSKFIANDSQRSLHNYKRTLKCKELCQPKVTMQFNAYVIALFSALASTSLADSVWTAFLDAAGAQIGTVNFKMQNKGCFHVHEARQVAFRKDSDSYAGGPYCLQAYTQAECKGNKTTQPFSNVYLKNGWKYHLDDGVSGATSFRWKNKAC
ncbi:hypothetical protein BDU57DRAFT_128417 [Ampelomyces quisqualis]|uniref:Uncharacterized protein n=1 Tax=Ampelomyces quisqualis TaxID=50730 RepID=A0A6A5QUH1_AMPQU|nr:hypothetical protein BDU57DRAFT_128417 [Ampelomyces quisqualis]